jgi:thioredoxin 2
MPLERPLPRSPGTAGSKVTTCGGCGQKNRVRAAATGIPQCGKCGRALPWVAEVTSADFASVVEESPLPVLVDFWAPWCGPCRIVAPAVEKLAGDLAGKLKVAKVNTDQEPGLGARFGIRGIPTLVLFEKGRERDRVTGALPGPALEQWVAARLDQARTG